MQTVKNNSPQIDRDRFRELLAGKKMPSGVKGNDQTKNREREKLREWMKARKAQA